MFRLDACNLIVPIVYETKNSYNPGQTINGTMLNSQKMLITKPLIYYMAGGRGVGRVGLSLPRIILKDIILILAIPIWITR